MYPVPQTTFQNIQYGNVWKDARKKGSNFVRTNLNVHWTVSECTLDCLNQELRRCIPQNILDKCQNECITLTGCIRKNKCVIQCLLEYHKGLLNADLKFYEEHELDASFYKVVGTTVIVVSALLFLVYNCLPDEDDEER